MSNTFKTCLMFVFLLCFGNILHAQQRPTDSLQSKIMKDSLQLSDSAINEVFLLREAFLKKAAEIRSDSNLNNVQVRNALNDNRKQTNDGIKLLMGEDTFEKYKQMIRTRMRARNASGNALAGDGD